MSSEDFLIFFSLSSSVSAAVAADRRDAAIMAELSDPALGRATLAPVTLACIGIDAADWRAIALGQPLPSDVQVVETSLDEFEHVELRDPDSYEHLPSDSWAGGFADNH
jgi:hypothetical protein